MRRGVTAVFLTIVMAAAMVLTGPAAQAKPGNPPGGNAFPDLITLPNGFQPEGISTGRGTSFFVGSLADGAIYRGDLRTGAGAILVPGEPGRIAVGTEVDSRNRLYVAGGTSGFGRVYDARTGKLLAEYPFTAPGTGFVNDVVVTRDAAYFTDSNNPVLYVVPFGRGGELGRMTTLPLNGELVYADGFNVNGIEASPDGRTLLVVQSNKGQLFAVSARTGDARQVDLGGYVLTNGDGLLRRGSTLYVVQNRLNQIAAFKLDRGYRSGVLTGTITDTDFQVPTTVAAFGSSLYAVNARFGTPPTPDTTYAVVRVPAC